MECSPLESDESGAFKSARPAWSVHGRAIGGIVATRVNGFVEVTDQAGGGWKMEGFFPMERRTGSSLVLSDGETISWRTKVFSAPH